MGRWLWGVFSMVAVLGWGAGVVPPAVEQPGTQPGEVASFATNCDACHAGTANPELEPSHGWHGGMMAHAMRDPLFWATLAIAEQDFLPGSDPATRGGAGDLCLRCHGPGGWLGGRSTPTDGSAFAGSDARGVECEHCHLMVDPDLPVNVAGTIEVQNPPYLAYDPATGEGYHGSGQYVINGDGTRLGPYADAAANHVFFPSGFNRDGDLCGTCHDVSNPVVGDLAHNNGAQLPLAPGSFSGSLTSPLTDKAQFNNPPHAYGTVERSFSEWRASALDDWAVNDYPLLPADLRRPGGALEVAYHRAFDARSDADYVDGTVRTFSCQTCHMAASTGTGCNKTGAPVRDDLPRHDLTGGGVWAPEAVAYQDGRGTLRFGAGLSPEQLSAMADARARAAAQLTSASAVSALQEGAELVVTVTNLTGHKLISGYPEGRRMWLNLSWRDSGGATIQEDGAYGAIGRSVDDLDGVAHAVRSLLDPESTVVYEAVAGLDQEWAAQLIGLGYPAGLVLDYDRLSDQALITLGELAAAAAGTTHHSFHFVLNNVVIADRRIPPYGFDRDEAAQRSALPVPATLFGDPPSGGTYQHRDVQRFLVPAGAVEVTVRLLYQQTSWEYVQFLWLGNDQLSPFLGQEGVNLLDAWLNTGQAEPFEMAAVTATVSAAPGAVVAGRVLTSPLRADLGGSSVAAFETSGDTLVASTASDAGGGFSIQLPPDSYRLVAGRDSFLWAETLLTVAAGDAVTLADVTLEGGDLDGNDVVNIVDMSGIAAVFGGADPGADLNGDGSVNIVDLAAAAASFGHSAPLAWP